MAVNAVVREWHALEGWGVVDAPETPGGCWAHFSHVAMAGYRELAPGQAVSLEWEAAEQDGYSYRAVRVWPAGEEPVGQADEAAGSAHLSAVRMEVDDEGTLS